MGGNGSSFEREHAPTSDKIVMVPVNQLKEGKVGLSYDIRFPSTSLLRSIAEVGVLNPLVITRDNEVLSGNRRMMAARILGIEKVPCVYAEVDPSDDAAKALLSVDANIYRRKTRDELIRDVELRAASVDAIKLSKRKPKWFVDLQGEDILEMHRLSTAVSEIAEENMLSPSEKKELMNRVMELKGIKPKRQKSEKSEKREILLKHGAMIRRMRRVQKIWTRIIADIKADESVYPMLQQLPGELMEPLMTISNVVEGMAFAEWCYGCEGGGCERCRNIGWLRKIDVQ